MNADIESRVDALESREAIRDLISGYCQWIDNHEIDRFVDLWHPDAEMLYSEPLGDFTGHDEIRGAITDVVWANLPESHHWTMNEVITFTDRDRAESLSDVSLVALTSEDTYVFIAATYRDVFTRVDGVWRFARRDCVIHYRLQIGTAADNLL